jgi:hypothetical protein
MERNQKRLGWKMDGEWSSRREDSWWWCQVSMLKGKRFIGVNNEVRLV